jgi:5-oxopent-3-ene-1,2,5-tricarboxylate decarboxylase / 2-hydroxyhepta-2,4-diene-1,7-dioate isomerase
LPGAWWKQVAKAFFKIAGISYTMESEVDPERNTVVIDGTEYGANQLQWEAPVSGAIYGVLLNYKGEWERFRKQMTKPPYCQPPSAPILYMKPGNTVNVHGGCIPLPDGVSELQVGAALGVVIGQTATKVESERAFDYINGYTIVNDVTIPHETIYRPSVKERSRDGFTPVGPWVVDKKDVDNPDSLDIRVFVNDRLVQHNNTKHLIRPVASLLADITEFMTLYPGDVLLVGVPERAPLVKSRDYVRIEIEKIGSLENTIVHERDWIKEIGSHETRAHSV